ncbi:hypothetical protein [Staphylococcus intermedius]|uniref:Uncharacterized protein n=1 Tax=Staphylococcus intermedius NCTC 11048 TaxID=1141106 RepID=A0A380G9S2_STAIN|nr:hypothetical protein [Staphylococcus intermedius]PCF88607.1 hypothetical protein B4W75_07505 [Staphylococcus intermedius]SUM47257.1 Uncharacterised protein [Staphylococcus intermedius NCTC 11048]
MERNTVNIDLEDYNVLLIKAEKYDALPKQKKSEFGSDYDVIASYSPDTCFIEVEGDVDYNKFKEYRNNFKKMVINFK